MKTLVRLALTLFLLFILACAVSAEDKITVVLDPGHGGRDPGTIVGTRYESEYINDITPLLKKYLEETGKFEVILTRGENDYLKYLPRSLVAFEADADILISLHFNSGDTPQKHGVEVLASVLDEWYPERLAKSITASISKSCKLSDGGVIRKEDTGDERGIYYWHDDVQWDIPGVKSSRKSDYYSMISWGTKLGYPAIIVEHAYLSNAGDLAFCDSAGAMDKLARAEADAIIEYYTGHTHTYGESTCDRAANCCFEGVFSRKCTVCGHRTDITRTPKDSSLHGWTEESCSASCTADGFISRECQVSRNLDEKGLPQGSVHTYYETLPAYGHNINVDFERAAAHAVDGYKKESCLNCGEVWEYFFAGEPHSYVSDGTVISCALKSPYVNYTCTVCNDTQRRTVEIPPHSFEVTESLDATCEADGYEKLLCTVCGHKESNTLPALGHDFGERIKDITCALTSSEITYTCGRCSVSVTETIEIPPHTDKLSDFSAPCCEADGFETYVCRVCGRTDKKILPAIGHSYDSGELVRDATYFKDGELRFVCANDDAHIKLESIPKKAGGIFIIAAAASASVLIIAVIAIILLKGAKKRLAETAEEASIVLTSEDVNEAKSEKDEKDSAEVTDSLS
ncbi:MAG: N-acetylmuramoyl-L-alanine amidase [Clostridia bacterium]|nr:N-acetylmuramoyl-L-alanine amidase [Clostridia bacterium]